MRDACLGSGERVPPQLGVVHPQQADGEAHRDDMNQRCKQMRPKTANDSLPPLLIGAVYRRPRAVWNHSAPNIGCVSAQHWGTQRRTQRRTDKRSRLCRKGVLHFVQLMIVVTAGHLRCCQIWRDSIDI